jgi:hypothetical protein
VFGGEREEKKEREEDLVIIVHDLLAVQSPRRATNAGSSFS